MRTSITAITVPRFNGRTRYLLLFMLHYHFYLHLRHKHKIMFRVYGSKTIFCHIPYALSQQRVTFSCIMYQATLRVLCNTFCNILFFSQPFSFIDKCILICGIIFVNCYIVLSKLFAAYIFV